MPRPRQERQRLRRRPSGEGSVPSLEDCRNDEKDTADVAVPRAPRAVLRGPCRLAVVLITWGSAPHPGSVAGGDPYAPRRSTIPSPFLDQLIVMVGTNVGGFRCFV